MSEPYALPDAMAPDLEAVRAYWQGLVKGANDMPFWDDFKPSALPEIAGCIALVDVFNEPFRLRFGTIVGGEIEQRYGGELRGAFVDSLETRAPLDFLLSQAAALVETSRPTYYRHGAPDGYSRLLLPMWGNGRVEMMLVAFSWR